MDTFVINALVQELQGKICPARIQAVRQPDAYTLIFDLWRQGTSASLAISIAPQHQYIFLTSEPPKDQGLGVGKFFQHHLRGGEIRSVKTPVLERIITLDIVKRDIDGTPLQFQLVLEFMGRHSNAILLAGDSGKILESLRHVTAAQSAYRRIAPGAQYVPPPSQEKRDPTTLTQAQFEQLVQQYAQDADSGTGKSPALWKFLLQHVQGISPVLAKNLAAADPATRWQEFSRMIMCVTSETYRAHELFAAADTAHALPTGLSAFALRHTECAPIPTMLQAVEHYYRASVEHQERQALRGAVQSSLRARLSKLQRKRRHLQEQEGHIEQAETYKQQGDLLTANLHRLQKGMSEATVIDYYSDDQSSITIPLNPKLTPAQNAQRYFKRYSKLKQGRAITQQRLQQAEQDIAYIEEWLYFVESANTVARLHELRQEIDSIFGKEKTSGKTSAKPSKTGRSQPYFRFTSSDGIDIYVGRSSKENDLLTQRTARSDDIWLHVHGAPGSHVLILAHDLKSTVPDRTLEEAAGLAAYHSKLRQSGKVEVMHTPRKYVKKPKGAPPGLVTVSRYHTIRVAPQADVKSET